MAHTLHNTHSHPVVTVDLFLVWISLNMTRSIEDLTLASLHPNVLNGESLLKIFSFFTYVPRFKNDILLCKIQSGHQMLPLVIFQNQLPCYWQNFARLPMMGWIDCGYFWGRSSGTLMRNKKRQRRGFRLMGRTSATMSSLLEIIAIQVLWFKMYVQQMYYILQHITAQIQIASAQKKVLGFRNLTKRRESYTHWIVVHVLPG